LAEASHAVFLSYASQDAEAAQKICEALRAAGLEVWFDKGSLRGGDAWDQSIRRQIKSCVLFIPVISRHTHDRDEGYFRLEWKLAVDRSHLMTANKPFLLPVVIDDTREDDENVPERFKDVQWTHLPAGETPPAFVERVRLLVSPEPSRAPEPSPATAGPIHQAARTARKSTPASPLRNRTLLVMIGVVVLGALAYLAIDKFRLLKHLAPAAKAFAPPVHSIAVLPFVNMSEDKEQEYFSEGLTEEILNSLAKVSNLQVAARTSSFYFKGKDVDLGTIAHKLNVASVLEGSVRRSGNTVRITTQLINAVTGFHLWSETYDRDLGDVLKLQTEIAGAVASALKVSLLGEETAKIELGGTRNPAAFDAYLRGRKARIAAHGYNDEQTAITAFTDAIGLDPNYALAFAERSIAFGNYAEAAPAGPTVRESFAKAQQDALKAIVLAPDLADGHVALATYFENGALNFAQANEEYQRALALAPGNVRVLADYAWFAVDMGRKEAGIAAARRAVVLDPLNRLVHNQFGVVLHDARQYEEAIAAFQDAMAIDPDAPQAYAYRGLTYYALGDLQRARESCETKPDYHYSQICLAMMYDKLGRHADAETMLGKVEASLGDSGAYQYAEIYAQWGNTSKALEWLETALRLRDPGLGSLRVDTFLDPVRKEPRFQAVERALKFPE